MKIDEMWSKLIEMGTSEEVLQVVTAINGYNEQAMCDILYAQYGYNDFEQID